MARDPAVLAKDHHLMQIRKSAVADLVSQNTTRHRRVPGEFKCEMDKVKKSCSSNSCEVLADGMRGRSCKDYCADDKRECVNAWEEKQDDCRVKFDLHCDQSLDYPSDLLCECSELQSVISSGAERSDPSELKLVWSDEFEGNSVDRSKWNMVHAGGGFGNQELQFYRHSNARVHNGILTITAQCEHFAGQGYTSAKL